MATPRHLVWDLYSLLLLLLARKLLVSWRLKGVFRRRYHYNPVPGHPPDPHKDLGVDHIFGTGMLIPMGGWDERIFPMLDHARHYTCCEGMC